MGFRGDTLQVRKKGSVLPMTELDGRQGERCALGDVRLTRVEYTEKTPGCGVRVDHATVVNEVEQFTARQQVPDTTVADKVGCGITEFRTMDEKQTI